MRAIGFVLCLVLSGVAPAQSIDGGARHLKQLIRRYKGDLELVAAAYNAGIGSVTQYKGIPPYRETIAYVAKVQALYERYKGALADPPKGKRGAKASGAR